MSFLKLRDGYLLINVDQIAAVEICNLKGLVTLSNGRSYDLAGDDAETVLDAIRPVGMAPVATPGAVAAALAVPVETVKADLEATSYKPAKRKAIK